MSNSIRTSTTLIRAENLRKNYHIGGREIQVLKGVTLEVGRGEFLALCGASGAGKSTLLHLLGGLDLPDSGDVTFQDIKINALSNAALTRLRNERCGFIFQAYHLLPELSALENVCLPARMARKSAVIIRKKAAELLTRVGLGHRLEHRPYELSGGEQQRVAIARALINDPTLILADEPTGNLDSKAGHEIIDLLLSLTGEKQSTLMIATHDLKIAERAQRIINLSDGIIVAQGLTS